MKLDGGMANDDIHAKIEQLRAKLAALKSIPQPNEPISEFSILDVAFLNEWDSRLDLVSHDTVIEEITTLLDEVGLPGLQDSEPRHDHLVIYHQVSQIRELARTVLSEAISLGYPHDLNVVAKTADIAPSLKNIATSLERIEARIDAVQDRSSPIGDGVAISVGPISISLNALREAAKRAREKIQLNQESTNVTALILALSKAQQIADKVGNQINELVREIPRRLRLALSEIVRLAHQAADQGIELLRSIRSRKLAVSSKSQESVLGARKTLIEVAETLRNLRESRGVKLGEMSRFLKIRTEYVKAIEAARFEDLPGRTYVIGWVRAYAEYLNLGYVEVQTLLNSLRLYLPGPEAFRHPHDPMPGD